MICYVPACNQCLPSWYCISARVVKLAVAALPLRRTDNQNAMPPKPQVFKAPDGREFSDRAQWRDYMMLTFYSFKNKVDEPEPLVKAPGSIDGQIFDIADCKNSTLVVMDQTEQVQIDQCTNCRIFIGACASSIFIRNCTGCTFYTACRQLRLRDVTDSTFYIYSMSEVHIEFSNTLRFAPFNGGYPEHEQHLKKANLDLKQNLWYDIYDHNDPGKTHSNWSLLPEEQYEAAWFPAGAPCAIAVPRVQPGGVVLKKEESMQSFSMQDMINDAKKMGVAVPAATAAATPPPLPAPVVQESDQEKIKKVVSAFLRLTKGSSLQGVVGADFHLVLPMGQTANQEDLETAAPNSPFELVDMGDITISASKDMAYCTFLVQEPGSTAESRMVSIYTGVLGKAAGSWVFVHAQKSLVFPL